MNSPGIYEALAFFIHEIINAVTLPFEAHHKCSRPSLELLSAFYAKAFKAANWRVWLHVFDVFKFAFLE